MEQIAQRNAGQRNAAGVREAVVAMSRLPCGRDLREGT
jgi:hypothetical protein